MDRRFQESSVNIYKPRGSKGKPREEDSFFLFFFFFFSSSWFAAERIARKEPRTKYATDNLISLGQPSLTGTPTNKFRRSLKLAVPRRCLTAFPLWERASKNQRNHLFTGTEIFIVSCLRNKITINVSVDRVNMRALMLYVFCWGFWLRRPLGHPWTSTRLSFGMNKSMISWTGWRCYSKFKRVWHKMGLTLLAFVIKKIRCVSFSSFKILRMLGIIIVT